MRLFHVELILADDTVYYADIIEERTDLAVDTAIAEFKKVTRNDIPKPHVVSRVTTSSPLRRGLIRAFRSG